MKMTLGSVYGGRLTVDGKKDKSKKAKVKTDL
jgi:hypothetical protein